MPRISHRPRRLRQSESIRNWVRESRVFTEKLCLPLFVTEGKDFRQAHKNLEISSTFSVDRALTYLREEIRPLKIPMILLFGVSAKKDSLGREALNRDSAVVRTIQEIRSPLREF